RFSSASTPLVLTVAMSCTLLFSATTTDHAVTQERQAGLAGELAITSTGGVPPATLADARAVEGVRSAVALTPTTLGPSLGASQRLQTLARRYPGLRVTNHASLATASDAEREANSWLGPLFVAIIFAFTSIAVVNTLAMIALQRGRELALLRLVGGTRSQVRSMARWEAGLIVTIGLGLGLAIAAAALLPLSRALTGSLRPYVPLG